MVDDTDLLILMCFHPCAEKVICEENEGIDSLRHRLFCVKVTASTICVQPRSRPPSSGATQYHSLRVYRQVRVWQGHKLDPLQWGWKIKDQKLVPLQTDVLPAPKHLLEVIRCKCKGDCTTL